MRTNDKRVAWILGAGFSVPLGGPPFRELISGRTLRQFASWDEFADLQALINVPQHPAGTFHGKKIDVVALAGIVLTLYEKGVSGRLLWGDAEEFLDILEIACTEDDPTLAAELHGLLGLAKEGSNDQVADAICAFQGENGLKLVHREAVRFVAAACTTFLRRFEKNSTLVHESELGLHIVAGRKSCSQRILSSRSTTIGCSTYSTNTS